MNWRWILMLAGLGVLVSIAGIAGWIPAGGYWIPIGLILIFAVLLGYNVRQKHFMHGFLTAVIWTLIGGLLQFMFWDTFIANNPEVAEKMAQVPEGMDMRPWMWVGIVFGAAIYGVILGLLTLLMGKLLREKETPAPPPEGGPTA
jgi:hypothetical protein